ncbi:MAG: 5-formyltetrahydrofolate cyclo-ligase [Granulosicoccus sp.]
MDRQHVQTRNDLRLQLRELRDALPVDEAAALSGRLCQRLGTLLDNVSQLGGYLALGNEANLSSLNPHTLTQSHRYYVPIVMDKHEMLFAPCDPQTPMRRNRYGIKEPEFESGALVSGMELDAVLVPLVGFDEQCNRMGMGGGYYDRCFAARLNTLAPPVLIGVAYECQRTTTVYPEPWDVPLDYIVTEDRTIQRR